MLALVLLATISVIDYGAVGALLASGDKQLAARDIEGAVRSYQAATELLPASVVAWRRLGSAYQKGRNIGAAVDAYQKASELAGRYDAPPVQMKCIETKVHIHMDCWGNGGPCPPGTRPNLCESALLLPNANELLRNAQIVFRPSSAGLSERIEIRIVPSQAPTAPPQQ